MQKRVIAFVINSIGFGGAERALHNILAGIGNRVDRYEVHLILLDDVPEAREHLHRIGLGVPDVMAAVQALRSRGIEFVESAAAHTERRGAITKTYLGSVVFELVLSDLSQAAVS